MTKKQKLKVLHIATGGKICGIATYTSNLIKHFDNSADHGFFELPSKADLADLTQQDIWHEYKKIIKGAKDYDVIHIQNEFGLFCGHYGLCFGAEMYYKILLGLKKLKKKVFTTFHSEPSFLYKPSPDLDLNKCHKYWKKIALLHRAPTGTKAIVHKAATSNSFKGMGFKNICTIVHGVLERTLPKNYKHKEVEDPVVLGIFGFVSPYKGHEFALSILDLLPSNYKLFIIGGRHPNSEGEELGQILIKANELGLSKRVTITGWCTPEEADKYQNYCDICLVPYQVKDLSASGAITWNLTSGKPVVASNIPSFKELNESCPNGDAMFLCHPTDRAEWVWAIKKILTQPKVKHSLINNARQYCKDFSWTNTCKYHMIEYNK